MNRRIIGDFGENAVCEYLLNNLYDVIHRNYTIRGGEVDIIAKKGDIIAFVEVKTRESGMIESGFEAITKAKKLRIMKTAQHYFCKTGCDLQPRFDVAVVEADKQEVISISYIENAYDMSDTNIFF